MVFQHLLTVYSLLIIQVFICDIYNKIADIAFNTKHKTKVFIKMPCLACFNHLQAAVILTVINTFYYVRRNRQYQLHKLRIQQSKTCRKLQIVNCRLNQFSIVLSIEDEQQRDRIVKHDGNGGEERGASTAVATVLLINRTLFFAVNRS